MTTPDSKSNLSSSRVVVASPDSVIEAEAIRSALVAAGIEAQVETQSMGTLFPHEAQAFGGIRVSVWAEDQAEAIEVLAHVAQQEIETSLAPALESSSQEPLAESPNDHAFYQYSRAMKNASLCAIFGWSFLPAPLWGLVCLYRASRIYPTRFVQEKGRVVLILLLNLLSLVCAAVVARILLLES
jgi:hypothetical protein